MSPRSRRTRSSSAATAASRRRSLGPAVARLPPDLQPRARTDAEIAAPGLRGGSVYTDDKAPVEWLVDASLVQVATDGDER